MLEQVYSQYLQIMARPTLPWQRYLFSKLPQNEKLLGVVGARGVGKTTGVCHASCPFS